MGEKHGIWARLCARWRRWRAHRRAVRSEQLLASARWRDDDELR